MAKVNDLFMNAFGLGSTKTPATTKKATDPFSSGDGLSVFVGQV